MAETSHITSTRYPLVDRAAIRESAKELRRLLASVRGLPEQERIRLLVLLKEDPRLTIDAAARRLGRTRRTLSRWLVHYRRGGIEALVRVGTPGRPRKLSEKQLEALDGRIALGASTVAEIRDWLRDELGVEYTSSGAWQVIRRDLRTITRGWLTIHDGGEKRPAGPGGARPLASDLTAFLNRLPTSNQAVESIPAFRDALLSLLHDVDRISINVDVNLDLNDPRSYQAGAAITQHVPATGSSRTRVRVSVSRASAETPSQRLLRGAKDSGFPLHQFHPPSCLDYHFGEVAYIGSLILWRSIEKPPISEETLAMVEGLRPFMLFAFSDLVARHRSEQPVHAALNRALETLAARARLSDQEQRIVMLQFMGHSYKEMADILSVTVDTVKKHFRQVHKKTGTRSQSELFAKYFTYRLD